MRMVHPWSNFSRGPRLPSKRDFALVEAVGKALADYYNEPFGADYYVHAVNVLTEARDHISPLSGHSARDLKVADEARRICWKASSRELANEKKLRRLPR